MHAQAGGMPCSHKRGAPPTGCPVSRMRPGSRPTPTQVATTCTGQEEARRLVLGKASAGARRAAVDNA